MFNFTDKFAANLKIKGVVERPDRGHTTDQRVSRFSLHEKQIWCCMTQNLVGQRKLKGYNLCCMSQIQSHNTKFVFPVNTPSKSHIGVKSVLKDLWVHLRPERLPSLHVVPGDEVGKVCDDGLAVVAGRQLVLGSIR
jgi:hypothetical protein